MRIRYDEETLRQSLKANRGIEYRQCSVSVMDTIRTDVQFDERGRSHFYHRYHEGAAKFIKEGGVGLKAVEDSVRRMQEDGRGKEYDCILGVSGGVDSSYLALLAKEQGLRVLCVHFDNGWNSELAIENIENIVSKCGFDLYTVVMDWEEFKALQLAYFRAHVIDIEAVTDIGIFAALDRVVAKFQVHHILDGRNHMTESVLGGDWTNKSPSNLLNIAEDHGVWPLKKFPLRNAWDVTRVRKGASKRVNHRWLDWVDYIKVDAKADIVKEFGWRDYGGKHYESVFTRFYQGYILPEKFGIDKRKAHLSNLIFSGQMTKEQALIELQKPMYDADVLKEDFQFVMKKLGFSQDEFYRYVDASEVSHSDFGFIRSRWRDWRFVGSGSWKG